MSKTIPMSGQEVLDRYFLEVRCKLLEVAASLDRIDRAGGLEKAGADDRLTKIRRALDILKSEESHRAEQLQMLFSKDYQHNWMNDWLENTAMEH